MVRREEERIAFMCSPPNRTRHKYGGTEIGFQRENNVRLLNTKRGTGKSKIFTYVIKKRGI